MENEPDDPRKKNGPGTDAFREGHCGEHDEYPNKKPGEINIGCRKNSIVDTL